MDHSILKSKLSEFYDGMLAPEEARLVSGHLESCGECRGELERFRKAAALFKEAPVPASPGFAGLVMARIRERERQARREEPFSLWEFLRLPRWEIAAVLSTALLVSSYFSLNYVQSRQVQEPDPLGLTRQQSGMERLILSRRDIRTEDLLQVSLGNGGESDQEAESYE